MGWTLPSRSAIRLNWDQCALCLGIMLVTVGATGQELDASRNTVDLVGRQVFSSSCSSCHGLDGRGGEHAPDIATKKEVQHLSDAALFRIVDEGVSGTGMPAFHSLGKPRIEAIVRYLRELQGMQGSTSLPGDPAKGDALFSGKAECSHCHVARGVGGFIGSDLSGYAHGKSASDIRNAITKPSAEMNRKSQVINVTTRDGQRLSGIVRNEDNFSLQLQTVDGVFYSFVKSDLQGMERSGQSLMPSDYGSRLTSTELDDLVSYLMKVAQAGSSNGDSGTQASPHTSVRKKE